jgi:hypothetical protein
MNIWQPNLKTQDHLQLLQRNKQNRLCVLKITKMMMKEIKEDLNKWRDLP